MANIGSIKDLMGSSQQPSLSEAEIEALRGQVMEAANGVLSLDHVSSLSDHELTQFISGGTDVREGLIAQAQERGLSDAAKREYEDDLKEMLHFGMTGG